MAHNTTSAEHTTIDIKKTVKDLKLRLRKERHLAEAVADPGGGHRGGGGGTGGTCPPPFRSSNYIFIVAQYSVLNCILNVQLSKASALRAGEGISPSRTHPLPVNHAHFSLNSNFSLLVLPPFQNSGSAPVKMGAIKMDSKRKSFLYKDCCIV